MKLVRILALVLVAYVAIGLAVEAAIATFQPRAEGTAVLRTWDAQGSPRDTVVGLREAPDGTLWVASSHWLRGWYERLRRNPEVALVRAGEVVPYTAVPDSSPEAVALAKRQMGEPGFGHVLTRTALLWAPIQPVRLEPRGSGEEAAP